MEKNAVLHGVPRQALLAAQQQLLAACAAAQLQALLAMLRLRGLRGHGHSLEDGRKPWENHGKTMGKHWEMEDS